MMKRMIVCLEEGARLFDYNGKYDGEHVKAVVGKAKADFLCDSCVPAHPIKRGAQCMAVSMWSDRGGVAHYPWENEYIEEVRT